ncbi:MAG: hypothetical protein HY518_00430 [Candidatus Aenigmarchaeota archaeon]|nr:hypothetical protein [Candidatus Aenigmarchaeota archaeon]
MLTVRQLLEGTYNKLGELYNKRERIYFQKPALAGIHLASENPGLMVYKDAILFNEGKKKWAVGMGSAERIKDAPIPYAFDLIALRCGDGERTHNQREIEVADMISKSWYFMDSLIVGMENGDLAVPGNTIDVFRPDAEIESKFGPEMLDFLEVEELPKYTIEYSQLSVIKWGCRPVSPQYHGRIVRYK